MPTCDEALSGDTSDGQLTVGGVDLITPAWEVTDLRRLWVPGAYRGTDTVIPFVPGVRPRPRRYNGNEVALPIVIIGEVDQSSVPYADPRAGLADNIEYLLDNVAAASSTPLTAELVMPNGTIRSGMVVPNGLTLGEGLTSVITGTLNFVVVDGILPVTSSVVSTTITPNATTGLGGVHSVDLWTMVDDLLGLGCGFRMVSLSVNVECLTEGATTPVAELSVSTAAGDSGVGVGDWVSPGYANFAGVDGTSYLGVDAYPPVTPPGFRVVDGAKTATYTWPTETVIPAADNLWVNVRAIDLGEAGDAAYEVNSITLNWIESCP